MTIHVVKVGESIYSIALEYGVPMSQIINDNELTDPTQLVVGQTLVILFPKQTHSVQSGETLTEIATKYGLTVRQMLRNNPVLKGEMTIYPGQTLVISYEEEPKSTLSVNAYSYPFITDSLLRRTLPYLTNLTPFTYGMTETGTLVDLEDEKLIAMAKEMGVVPLMHLSTLTDEGNFSSDLASLILNDSTLQKTLTDHIVENMQTKGYQGLDVDFEFIPAKDAQPYAAFIRSLADRLHPLGYLVYTAVAPKTSSDQPGLLYQGHSYADLGAAADGVLLMTYEWGYTYGPPMAVSPLPNVRQVVEYAITEIPKNKIWLGISNYGYDWALPYVKGTTRATSISNQYAVSIARKYKAVIQFDETAQAPWFRYHDENGVEHEVWFEDARSIKARLALIPEYGLYGAGYWNLVRPFPQNWRVLNALYNIRES